MSEAIPTPAGGCALIMLDRAGRVRMWNKEAERLFGWSADEIVGQPYPAVPPAARPEFDARMEAALGGEVFSDLALRRLRKDGSQVEVLVTTTPVWDDGGGVSGVVSVFIDADLHRRAGARARLLADASGAFGGSLDLDETLASVSRFLAERVADACVVYMAKAGSGQPAAWSVAARDAATETALRARLEAEPPDPASPGGVFGAALSLDAPTRMEALSAFARHDRWGFPHALLVPLRGPGEVAGAAVLLAAGEERFGPEAVASLGEVAERAGAALDHAALFRAAERASRARDDVLGIVAHDLRSPLQAVTGGAQMLLEPGAGDDEALRTRMAEAILRSADRIGRLVQDLLDVATIEAGGLTLAMENVAPAALLDEARTQLSAVPTERGQTLLVEAGEELPAVRADPHRILQLFSNLVGNAAKFTPEGGRITLRAEALGGMVRFSVTDTGPGIPAEMIGRIWDRFFQARSARRAGAGLGLAIARGIAEAHHGRIWAESTPGDGATFFFTLPVAGAWT